MNPPLSIPEAVKILCKQYPEGLVCGECAVLLATRESSYAQSRRDKAGRLRVSTPLLKYDSANRELVPAGVKHEAVHADAFVCAGCRFDREERARVQESKAQKGRRLQEALRPLGARDSRTGIGIAVPVKSARICEQAPKTVKQDKGLQRAKISPRDPGQAIPQSDPSPAAIRAKAWRAARKTERQKKENERRERQREYMRKHRAKEVT